MARPVLCRIVDMPDGRFAVMATVGFRKDYCREGLLTLAAAEEAVEVLRDIMAACGPPLVRDHLALRTPGAARALRS